MTRETDQITIHQLKTTFEYFQSAKDKLKMFEIRINDRDFQVGDIVILRLFDNKWNYGQSTNVNNWPERLLVRRITYILDNFEGLSDGYVGIGLETLKNEWSITSGL